MSAIRILAMPYQKRDFLMLNMCLFDKTEEPWHYLQEVIDTYCGLACKSV